MWAPSTCPTLAEMAIHIRRLVALRRALPYSQDTKLVLAFTLHSKGMDINPQLFVEIHPFDGPHSPHPHPIEDGHFDPEYVYKVLGMFNPSETSECYFVLSNPQRQIWFIPQRHLLAFRLIDSDEFFLRKEELNRQDAKHLSQEFTAEARRT